MEHLKICFPCIFSYFEEGAILDTSSTPFPVAEISVDVDLFQEAFYNLLIWQSFLLLRDVIVAN